MYLTNKVVVITGGAQGIGYEIADKFLENGAKTIILLDINETNGTDAVGNLKIKHGDDKEVVFFKCDVTKDLQEISKKILDSYKVDILINNAGIIDDADVKKAIDINVLSVLEWGLKFWEQMSKHKGGNGGTIINLSSIYGFRIDPLVPVYQAAKTGVLAFTKSLGHETNFEKSGVRVLAICPGFTRTGFGARLTYWHEGHLGTKILEDLMKVVEWQDVDAVGHAAVEVIETAKSGTGWLIEGGKPISEV